MIGKTLFGYEITKRVGSGSFGTVYKAEKTNMAGKYVRAIKHISLPSTEQYVRVLNSMGGDYAKANDYFDDAVKDVIEEIRIISELSEKSTPNIVNYYDSDIQMQNDPRKYDIYILMEYLKPLTAYLIGRELKIKDVISIGKDILSGLIICHDSKIIHRDIKDDNIFVNSAGVYKLGDFGVSKFVGNQSGAVSMKGTPEYIAPEVYLGKDKYDVTVDIYSLGIVLYRLLNRSRNPFMPKYPNTYNSSDEEIAFQKRMKGEIPDFPVDAQNELGRVVVRALLQRDQRYNNAREFLIELKNAERGLPYHELDRIINTSSQTEFFDREEKQYDNQNTIGSYMDTNEASNKKMNYDRNMFETIGESANNINSEYTDEGDNGEGENTQEVYKKVYHNNTDEIKDKDVLMNADSDQSFDNRYESGIADDQSEQNIHQVKEVKRISNRGKLAIQFRLIACITVILVIVVMVTNNKLSKHNNNGLSYDSETSQVEEPGIEEETIETESTTVDEIEDILNSIDSAEGLTYKDYDVVTELGSLVMVIMENPDDIKELSENNLSKLADILDRQEELRQEYADYIKKMKPISKVMATIESNSVYVNWQTNDDSFDGYRIYCSEKKKGGYALLVDTEDADDPLRCDCLIDGDYFFESKEHYIKVRAYKKINNSYFFASSSDPILINTEVFYNE